MLYNQGEHWFPLVVVVVNKSYQIYQCSSHYFGETTGIYLSEGYGYFSLDGLTIKKEILGEMGYWFNPSLRLHQDTEFLIRLAYTARLFPGEIKIPTVKRGVHGRNRVVNLQFDVRTRNQYQEGLWKSLYEWAETQKIPERYRNQIYRILLIKMLHPYKRLHRFFLFIAYAAQDRFLFLDTGCYNMAHLLLFGNNKISHLLLSGLLAKLMK